MPHLLQDRKSLVPAAARRPWCALLRGLYSGTRRAAPCARMRASAHAGNGATQSACDTHRAIDHSNCCHSFISRISPASTI